MNSKSEQNIIEISDSLVLEIDPVVSVIMITYNHEAYLSESIEAVLAQVTDFPFELIIGEDCSPDNTRQIAIEYQKKYPQIIRIITSEKNVGMSKNQARILSASRGKYIAYCDGDDCWNDTQKLQKQADFLEKNHEYVAVYHDAILLNKFNEGEKISVLPEGGRKDFSKMELTRYAFMPTLSILFRNKIRTLPEEYFKVLNNDTFLISLLGEYGGAKFLSDIQPGLYREHAGGIWSGLSPQNQSIGSATTCFWQMVYYNRIGKVDIANYFAFATIDHILSVIKINKGLLLKWFIIKYFSKTYQYYLRIKQAFGSKYQTSGIGK
ncbi:MAG: glycosyltransferase [Methylotenera sp.]|nr:glycosyltransferase [Methylotenera sp.]